MASEGTRVVHFGTFGHGVFSLREDLCVQPILHSLVGLPDDVEGLVVVDHEGEEVFCDGEGTYAVKQNTPLTRYLLATEEDVEAGGAKIPRTQEEMNAFVARSHRIADMKRRLIVSHYRPLHPAIYEYDDSILDANLRAALEDGTEEALRGVLTQVTETGLYTFRCFSADFCRLLCEEVHHFESSGLPSTRPNSMNNYGVILDDIGFTPFLTRLRERLVVPFASLLFKHRGGETLDGHHGFVVQYTMAGDRKLDFHFDESEVTLNVCLGVSFEGGELYFRGILEDESTHEENVAFAHEIGTGLIHAGKHRHGASPLTSGERLNLILWCRSETYRKEHGSGCSCGGHDHSH